MSIQPDPGYPRNNPAAITLWSGFIRRFMSTVPRWLTWYPFLLAGVGIIGNVMPLFDPALSQGHPKVTAITMVFGVLDLLYTLLGLLGFIFLGWAFGKGLRSGKRQLALPAAAKAALKPRQIRVYVTLRTLSMDLFLPIMSLALFMAYSQFTSIVLPTFAGDQHLSTGHSPISAAILAVLASTEELWRWSMIFVTLWIARRLSRSRWQRDGDYRHTAFILALILSSLFFGLGHAAEFSAGYHTLSVLVLGSAGLVLAVIAILTRRLWIAIVVHGVYDFLAISGLFGDYVGYIYLLTLLGLLVVLPLFMQSWRRIQSAGAP